MTQYLRLCKLFLHWRSFILFSHFCTRHTANLPTFIPTTLRSAKFPNSLISEFVLYHICTYYQKIFYDKEEKPQIAPIRHRLILTLRHPHQCSFKAVKKLLSMNLWLICRICGWFFLLFISYSGFLVYQFFLCSCCWRNSSCKMVRYSLR